MNEEIEYQEDFVRTTQDPKYVFQQACEAHPREDGWRVGTPIIENLGDGNYKITIPLMKIRVRSK